MHDTTARILERVRGGDEAARAELLARLYGELRALAGKYLAGERAGHTLQPTALVNEAFLRLAQGSAPLAEERSQVFACAARTMRQVLVDHARARQAAKRAGLRIELEEEPSGADRPTLDLLALDAALAELEEAEPALARLIELRFFTGLESDEIARVERLSERTVRRDLAFAREWLRRRMEGRSDPARES